jgi:hypothetical protein
MQLPCTYPRPTLYYPTTRLQTTYERVDAVSISRDLPYTPALGSSHGRSRGSTALIPVPFDSLKLSLSNDTMFATLDMLLPDLGVEFIFVQKMGGDYIELLLGNCVLRIY